jgi:chemotaxis response regulator CheB
VVWGMPGSAVDAGLADAVVPLMQIPEAVVKLL